MSTPTERKWIKRAIASGYTEQKAWENLDRKTNKHYEDVDEFHKNVAEQMEITIAAYEDLCPICRIWLEKNIASKEESNG